jgi:PAS domain S-box-containing protein
LLAAVADREGLKMEGSKDTDRTEFLRVDEINLTLPEAENILRALRTGEVDGVMVSGVGYDRVFMLSGADHPYRLMIEAMSEGAVTITGDGIITYCNNRFAEMAGTSTDRLIGSPLSRLVIDTAKLQGLINGIGDMNCRDEITLKSVGGSTISTLFSVSPLLAEDELVGLCIVVTDMTDQKRNLELKAATAAEQRLREQAESARKHISKILDSITDSYISLDRRWVIADVNERAASNCGKSRAELIGKNLWDLFPNTVGSAFYREFHHAMNNGGMAHFEAASIVKPESWFEVHAYSTKEGLSVYLRDITERKRSESERERLLTELSDTNRRKDEFLAMLSHELRNPLAPISNALEVLRRLDPDEPELRQSRDVINRQVNDLARLIDDLLDASRITTGKVRLHTQTVELASVVNRAIESSRPLIKARNHRLAVSLPSEPIWLNVDSTRVAQVLNNLLNNAAKFTEEGGDISLSGMLEGREVVIRVKDTGVGILPEILPHVFDLFTQADRSLDRSQGGLGIGLTLARSIVGLHGGTVHALSDGTNKGSEFVVRLPIVDGPDRDSEQPEDKTIPGPIQRRRILVVDDNTDSVETMATLIGLSGHEIAMANDGETALEVATSFRPEIILLDVGLPGMHGYEVARRLRAIPENKKLVIVALTGYGQEEDRQRAMDAGFDYHFVKPVDFTALEALINRRDEG